MYISGKKAVSSMPVNILGGNLNSWLLGVLWIRNIIIVVNLL